MTIQWLQRLMALLLIAAVLAGAAVLMTSGEETDTEAEPKTYTVGYFNPISGISGGVDTNLAELKTRMTAAGYTEGENITYVVAETPASQEPEALLAVLQPVIDQQPDVLICASTGGCTVAKNATQTIPIVFMLVADPISAGLVEDFSKPGENITGVASAPKGLVNEGRGLEWLLQVAPDTKRILIPHNPQDMAAGRRLEVTQATAAEFGVETVVYDINTPEDLNTLLAEFPEDVDAVITYSERTFTVDFMTGLTALLIERQLPHLSFSTNFGQLMSYAPSSGSGSITEQVVNLTQRILGGAKTTDLPVETPEYNLVIHLPTLEAMGLEIPDDILRQAVITGRE